MGGDGIWSRDLGVKGKEESEISAGQISEVDSKSGIVYGVSGKGEISKGKTKKKGGNEDIGVQKEAGGGKRE